LDTEPKSREPNDMASGPKTAVLYDQLRRALADEDLAPGDRISEGELGRRYSVSRTPIREALARLEQDGLIERRGAALYVRTRTADEIIDIYRVRVYLEGAIAFDAAHRRSETDLLRLAAAGEQCERLVARDDPHELQAANLAFHRALADASHNQTLQDLQDRLTAQVSKLPSTTLSYPGRWSESVREHRELVDAIRDQDGDRARTVGSQHMNAAAEIRLRLIARLLDTTPPMAAGAEPAR
jgi:DNA-binding GntR family transcriptional regulator